MHYIKNHIRELYGLRGNPTAIACRVEYLLEDDRFMCPSNGYEVCIRPLPVAQPGLPITTDYDLDGAYIIPVPCASDCRRHLWQVFQWQEKAWDARSGIHQSCQWYDGGSHLCNPVPQNYVHIDLGCIRILRSSSLTQLEVGDPQCPPRPWFSF